MKFERVFSNEGHAIPWSKRDARILNSKGNVLFEQKDVEAPSSWSDNAVNIVASKYFKKINGVQETSVHQLLDRVVKTICTWGDKFNYFATTKDHDTFYNELYFILENQYACFNSPIWFNFGVPTRSQQAAACFLLGLDDTIESIYDWISVEAKIFKGGSGAGVNISPLRSRGSHLSSGGASSGPMSFLKARDHSAGAIKSGGTTRRAATLTRMDATHPDIEEFITCKSKEEKKAQVLIAAGYDGAIDGEAYSTVAFQNMNHSVGVTADFMKKVMVDEGRERDLLRLMARCAWESGDPGIQYDDTINKWNTIPNSGRITTSNPCGEYLSTDWSSCLLASFNLLKFRDEETGFNFDRFAYVTRIVATALDIIIDGADYPDPRFKETARRQRQIGLGYSNLGSLLMSLGLSYSSPEGRNLAAEITSTMTAEAYIQSSRIAEKLSPFEDYFKNAKDMTAVIDEHTTKAIEKWGSEHHCYSRWDTALSLGKKHGYRNATVSLIAPTGTISFMMDCDTTGIEPEFSLVKYKSLVGGGNLALVNGTTPLALKKLGYTEEASGKILNYIQANGTVENCELFNKSDLPVFDCAMKSANGTRFISYHDHMKMVAAVQPFLSMGISKTINMPTEATIEDVIQVYIDGWQMGIKSVAIYRDGSKLSQPLNVEHKKELPTFVPSIRKSMPPERPALIHKFEISGFEAYLHVGLYENGMPGEIFIDCNKVGSTISGLLDGFATAISYGLQYGVPLEILISKFTNTRFEPAGFTKNPKIRMTTSIIDYIFKWLESKFMGGADSIEVVARPYANGHSTPTGLITTMTGEICARCGSLMQRTGTCLACSNCSENLGGCGG